MGAVSETVELEIAEHIAVVTINRPEARNSIDLSVTRGLCAALDEVEARDDVSVAILTGVGGNFCSGMDLKAFLRGEVVRVPGRGFGGVTQFVSGKPWIAVAGDASGKAHLLIPESNGPGDWNYREETLAAPGGTVGQLAVGDVNGDDWAEVFVPAYDRDLILAYTFAPASA